MHTRMRLLPGVSSPSLKYELLRGEVCQFFPMILYLIKAKLLWIVKCTIPLQTIKKEKEKRTLPVN